MPKVIVNNSKGLYQETGKGFVTQTLASHGSQGDGTAIANDTNAVTFQESDSGKIFTCAMTTAGTKNLTIPANLPLGWNITVVQIAQLAASGVLVFKVTDGTDYCAVGSYAINGGHSVAGDAAVAADDKLTITGANTNCGWGVGSVLKITKVTANRFLFEAIGSGTGTGSTALAFGAQ